MRYPTLTSALVEDIVKRRLGGEQVSLDGIVVWRGQGETIDLTPLDAALAIGREHLEKIGTDPSLVTDKEPFEGALAVQVFPILDAIPIEILDDPGFWRYLAIDKFWWFIEWREARPIEAGRWMSYVDARRSTESIPTRLYLRARAVADSGALGLAQELTQCTDFWRSHVTRVRTGSAPVLAAAFASIQKDPASHMATTALRGFARRLNRMWTNVHLNLYSPEQAAAILNELSHE